MSESIDFVHPLVMGILNATPDSFYVQSRIDSLNLLKTVEGMIEDGADIIDVGGYSSRPGAQHVSITDEIDRVLPIVKEISQHFPEIIISVDTFRAEVAKACLNIGVKMINDISGGTIDDSIMAATANANAYYVLMHMRGTPQTMMDDCNYDDLVLDVINELTTQMNKYPGDRSKLIIDPGFGFSKTMDQNYALLNDLNQLQSLHCPLLVGVSRKSMIYKFLNSSPEEALNGTTAIHTIALLKGANILRVHDVKEAKECIKLVSHL